MDISLLYRMRGDHDKMYDHCMKLIDTMVIRSDKDNWNIRRDIQTTEIASMEIASMEEKEREKEREKENIIKKKDYLQRLLYELTICCYYVKKGDPLRYYDILWSQLNHKLMNNMQFYLKPLESVRTYRLSPLLSSNMIPRINGLDTNPHCYPCNPSIVPYKDGFLVNIRWINYVHMKTYYAYSPPDTKIRSINSLVYVTKDFTVIKHWTMMESSHSPHSPYSPYRPRNISSRIRGMEDCRLFWNHDDTLGLTCSVGDVYNQDVIAIGYGNVKSMKRYGDLPSDAALYVNLHIIPSPKKSPVEKNWLWDPVMKTMLYSYNPLTFYSLDETNYTLYEPVSSSDKSTLRLIDHRGSAGPIPLNGYRLYLVHSHLDNCGVPGRTYIHRFICLDHDSVPVLWSHWFYLSKLGIEFASGLSEYDSEHIIIGYGMDDSKDHFVVLKKEYILTLLHSPTILS